MATYPSNIQLIERAPALAAACLPRVNPLSALVVSTDPTERHLGRCINRLEDTCRTIEIAKSAIKGGNAPLALFYLTRMQEGIAFDLSLGVEAGVDDRG